MSEDTIYGTGGVVAVPKKLAFTGWLVYDPLDPEAWPMVTLDYGTSPSGRPHVPDGRVARRVKFTLDLP